MAKSGMNGKGASPRATTAAWMSLKDASELTGTSRAELRSRIAAGELAARTIRRGDKVEHRLTRAALAEAGLIGAAPAAILAEPPKEVVAPVDGEPERATETMAQLIGLIREQNQRIATLEDQRAQLAARLGATVEAMHQLEDRLEVILDARAVPQLPASPPAVKPVTTADGLVLPVAPAPSTVGPASDAARATQLHGVRRTLARLVRDVAQPRLRELSGGQRREPSAGD